VTVNAYDDIIKVIKSGDCVLSLA